MKTFLKNSAAALLATSVWLCPCRSMAQIPLGGAGVSNASQAAAAVPIAGSLPGNAPAGLVSLAGATTVEPVEAVEEEVLTDTDLICVVGSEHILAGDMRIIYEPHIEEWLGRITPAEEKMLRQRYTRDALKEYVKIKAMYQEFIRENAGKTAAPYEIEEAEKKIRTKANMYFHEQQVPSLLKSYKVADVRALEEKLRSKSMSLKQVQQQFVERVLATQAEVRNVPEEVEIGRDELVKYYEEHAEDWKKPGRAKWRQLTARFDRFPTEEAAKSAIEAMGNEVLFGGNFEAVARGQSQGFTAEEGGVYDWTTQGALKSTKLDQAIFSLPLRHLSQVIEDDIGFHIIEVLEREDASTLSFEAAQDEMRKAINKTKVEKLRDAYHKKVMERTVVWTRWPEDIPGSRSLTEVVGESPLTLADPPR